MANTELKITELCREKGTTVAAVAEKMGIKAQSLSQSIYRGTFTLSRLGEIADILGVSVPELFVSYNAPTIAEGRAACPHCGKAVNITLSK